MTEEWRPFQWDLKRDGRTVTFECTYIDGKWRNGGKLGEWDGMRVGSYSAPQLQEAHVCLRGSNTERDCEVVEWWCSTEKEAIAYMNRGEAALQHVHDDLVAKHEAEKKDWWWCANCAEPFQRGKDIPCSTVMCPGCAEDGDVIVEDDALLAVAAIAEAKRAEAEAALAAREAK